MVPALTSSGDKPSKWNCSYVCCLAGCSVVCSSTGRAGTSLAGSGIASGHDAIASAAAEEVVAVSDTGHAKLSVGLGLSASLLWSIVEK